MGPPRRIPERLASRDKAVRYFWFSFFLLFVSVRWAGAQNSSDPMARHYKAAQTALRSNNQDLAATEYKAFLSEAIHRVANAKGRAGNLSDAAGSFEEALAISGSDLALRLDYASVLLDEGNFRDAAATAQRVVEDEPKNARARVLLARAQFEQKDYSAAKDNFKTALEAGRFAEVWRLLAITYLRLQDLDSARALIHRAITAIGDTPRNRVETATVYYYGDYPEVAAEELQKVIARHPTAPEAHYYLGLAYLGHNEEAGYTKAVPEFREQLKIDPDDFGSHYILGHVAMQQRNFVEAEQELLRARALNPQDAGTQLLLGQLYSEANRNAEAETTLRNLIASWDENSPPDFRLIRAHYMLGRLLQESGRADDGISEIKIAEQMRKQLRASTGESSESSLGNSERSAPGTLNVSGEKKQVKATAAEEAKARAFIAQISPLIGEAYYNLAGISSQHGDSAAMAHYLQLARQWDPTLTAPQH